MVYIIEKKISFLELNVERPPVDSLSCFRRSTDLNDPQQVQNDEDDGNDE